MTIPRDHPIHLIQKRDSFPESLVTGENFDSPPAHTKFSGGKSGIPIVTGKNTPTPAENPRSVQKMGCQKRGIAGPKREITMFKVGGRLTSPRAYSANLSALYSVLIMKYQSDPSDLCRNRENRVKTGVFWVGDFHDLATWRFNKSRTNSLHEI